MEVAIATVSRCPRCGQQTDKGDDGAAVVCDSCRRPLKKPRIRCATCNEPMISTTEHTSRSAFSTVLRCARCNTEYRLTSHTDEKP